MIIAIDLDGTAIDNNSYFRETLLDFLHRNSVYFYNGKPLHAVPLDGLWKALKSIQKMGLYYRSIGTRYIHQPLAEGLSEFLNAATSHGDIVNVITARGAKDPDGDEHMETVEYIRTFMPEVNHIYTGRVEKLSTLREMNAAWFVDDFHGHVDSASMAGINSIQYMQPGYADRLATNLYGVAQDFFEVRKMIYGG